MSRKRAIILTCEHAGNVIPSAYRCYFEGADLVLRTHRGWDIGALNLAKALQHYLHVPLFYNQTSRLLIDNNRSLGHRHLFSEFSRKLSEQEKANVIDVHYLRHRLRVEKNIRKLIDQGRQVLHIGVHSFTPKLNGKIRTCDIGLLYDPRRPAEVALAAAWQAHLIRHSRLRVRRKYPYWGHTDGFGTYLRQRYPAAALLSVELEINQALLKENRFSKTLFAPLSTSMADLKLI